MIADDWYYTLWHMKTTRPAIEEIAKRHDIFSFSVGECDLSFDFVLYKKGLLERKYVVESPHFTDRVVVENLGQPMPAESGLLVSPEGHDVGMRLAESLGIQTMLTQNDLRIYEPHKSSC